MQVWLEGVYPRAENPQIEVFLNKSGAGYEMPGCHVHSTQRDILALNAHGLNVVLQRQGDKLTVDGELLPVQDVFEAVNYLYWKPWLISRIRFRNFGVMADCASNSAQVPMMIEGQFGAERSLIKGFLFLAVCSGGLALTAWRSRKLKT